MFEGMCNDVVSLKKKNGETIENIKAIVQPTKIFIDDATVPIEEGDVLSRSLPSGLSEEFIVEERGFYAARAGNDAHYQVKVRKASQMPKTKDQPQKNTYILHGTHARVNIHSVDSSINISKSDTQAVFSQIQQAIKTEIQDSEKQSLVLSKLDELQSSINTPSYLTKYQEFIGLVADHITVFAPFIPHLTSLLHGVTT
jgi:hypothetical protein